MQAARKAQRTSHAHRHREPHRGWRHRRDGSGHHALTAVASSRPREAIELPMDLKRRLRLDVQRSWVVCSELNRFAWPGPDLRPVSRQWPGEFVYGALPAPFMRQVFERLAALRAERKPRIVVRPV